MAMLLTKHNAKILFGAHHLRLINLAVLSMLTASFYAVYWVLTKNGHLGSGWDVWGVTTLLSSALAAIIVSFAHFAVPRAYRRLILMKTIQFVFFAVFAGGLGYIGFDAWVVLYSKQPAEATLIGLIAAVTLYGLRDVASLLARAVLVKTMAVADINELPSLSEEGKYRVAIHEAGHALCYSLCDGVPEDAYVVIEQDFNELIAGRVNLPEPREPTDFTLPHIDWQLLMLMAGVAAEKEVFGDGSMLGGGDMSAFNLHAAVYLMSGHGEVYIMEPDNELDIASNRLAIGRLREEYRSRATEFIRANRALVASMARDLCAMEFMDCEEISKQTGQVVRPDGHVPVIWPGTLAIFNR